MAILFTSCRSPNGLLLLTGGASFTDFLLIRLTNGRLSLSFENFGGIQDATTSSNYDDGESHTLQVTHHRRDIIFIVDGREQPVINGFEAGTLCNRYGLHNWLISSFCSLGAM